MKRISKVEIKNFRSIKTEVIGNLSELNVFSGCNDVGKSNVLRALDMFFNKKNIDFYEEFNIERKAEIKQLHQQQIISIKVYFINDTYRNLPANFFVKRTWDKSGEMSSQSDDTETWRKKQNGVSSTQVRTALSMYLNKFRFKYIPAIKENSCFNTLLVELYNAIVDNKAGTAAEFEGTLSDFNSKLAELSQELSDFFLKTAGIRSTVAIPTTAGDLAKRLAVSTYADANGEDKIPLFNRGDGIRMHYIPAILNFISDLENNKWHIWAIDEPETSCEYSKSAVLANDFVGKYAMNNQIFIASHSFHFISLTGDNVSRYRVFRKDNKSHIRLINTELFEQEELKSELGILSLLHGLQEVYDNYQRERELISANIDIIKHAEKPLLLFEGESDRILFQKAFGKLYPNERHNFIYSEPAEQKKGGAVVGEGANALAGFLYSHIPKIGDALNGKKIIAIFDNDKEGVEQYNKIAKDYEKSYQLIEIDGISILKHKKYNVYVTKLIAPNFRSRWIHEQAKYCYLSVELLLQDNYIPEINRDYIPDTTPSKYSFKAGNKVNFANSVSDNTDFSGFRGTIDLLMSIKNEE
ncbi:MAG: ATP-binding protein [Alistipes senegalensis]|nr:ATP-binding protein [Bacteroides cellulosilyticus]MCM1351107.1 ATP-binding protein [Alistipes senegalensis]